jgi:hypothetical protein
MTALEIVKELNERLVDKSDSKLLEADEFTPFLYRSDGGGSFLNYEEILYGDLVIWDSENDGLCLNCTPEELDHPTDDPCSECPVELWDVVIAKAKEVMTSQKAQINAAVSILDLPKELPNEPELKAV